MKLALCLLLCAIAAHADALSDAYDALKRAEAAKDGAAVLQNARETSRLAREAMAKQEPPEKRDQYQKDRAIYLEQTDTYTEYSMAVAASYPGNSTATTEQLVGAIIAQKPKSPYLTLAVGPYLTALARENPPRQLDGAAKILAVQPDDEDALLAQAEGKLSADQFVEAGQMATRILDLIPSKPRPEAYSEEYWSNKKAALISRTHFIAGTAACRAEQWADCDAQVRQVKADEANAAAVNFYLGWSNFNLAKAAKDRPRMQEARDFMQKAADAPGPIQQTARQNLTAIEQSLKQLGQAKGKGKR